MSKKKLAVFVEGQTEQIFLMRLISEIAGHKNVTFNCQTLHAGVLGRTVWMKQAVNKANVPDEIYSILLVDCMGDETVKSTLLDQRPSLLKSGYSLILGVRDLYPRPLADLEKIKRNLAYGVPTADTPTHILLAVSEIEAWFLQEHLHYQKIDIRLDPTNFRTSFGFDPINDIAETVHHAAGLLNQIYASVGKKYDKSRKRVQQTVDVLDYGELYLNLPGKLPYLGDFIKHIDNFLT